MIYTSNAIENFNRQLRKITQTGSASRLSPILCKPQRGRRIYLRQTEGYIWREETAHMKRTKEGKGYVNCFRLPTSGVCRIFRSFSKRQ